MSISYEYNGKTYEFILSIRAKIEIEKAQKSKLKNPVVAKLALQAKDGMDNMSEEQLISILPYMDELGDLDPLEIGYILLSTYPAYRGEVTREFYNALVDDMDMKTGIEATAAFFDEVRDLVFTQLAELQKKQDAIAESRKNLLSVVK